MGLDITIHDNFDQIKNEFAEKLEMALESCGMDAEGFAMLECPVDTGNLRNSITHQVNVSGSEAEMIVGTNVHYAPYVELGTGKYYPGGRQTPWSWQDEDGNWHRTAGMPARPFIKPALADHIEEYKEDIAEIFRD